MVNNGTRMGAGRLPAVALAMLLALPFASAQAQGEAESARASSFTKRYAPSATRPVSARY